MKTRPFLRERTGCRNDDHMYMDYVYFMNCVEYPDDYFSAKFNVHQRFYEVENHALNFLGNSVPFGMLEDVI